MRESEEAPGRGFTVEPMSAVSDMLVKEIERTSYHSPYWLFHTAFHPSGTRGGGGPGGGASAIVVI